MAIRRPSGLKATLRTREGRVEGGGTVRAMGLGNGNRAIHAARGKVAAARAENHNFGAAGMGGALQFAPGRKLPDARRAVVGARAEFCSVRIEGNCGNR